MANIPGVEPTIHQHARGLGFVAPIAVHDEFAAHEDFTVLGDFDLNALKRRADGFHLKRRIEPVA